MTAIVKKKEFLHCEIVNEPFNHDPSKHLFRFGVGHQGGLGYVNIRITVLETHFDNLIADIVDVDVTVLLALDLIKHSMLYQTSTMKLQHQSVTDENSNVSKTWPRLCVVDPEHYFD